MKILTALVGDASAPDVLKIDAIRWRKKLWLVPAWIELPSRGVRRPARLIRFDTLPHQDGTAFADFVLKEPIPRGVLLGSARPEECAPYEIVEGPDLTVPIPRTSLN